MIISSPAITSLLRATDKATPEMGDNEIVVPNILLMAQPPILPIDVLTSSAGVQQNSFMTEAQINLGPSGASSQNLFTLGAGIWDLQIEWGTTSTGFTIYEGFSIDIAYQGFSIRLIGSQNISNQPRNIPYRTRFLLRDTAVVSLEWPVIPAASVLVSNLGIVCNRSL